MQPLHEGGQVGRGLWIVGGALRGAIPSVAWLYATTMLMAAGVEPPKKVFGHGFVYKKDESTGERVRESKSLGNVTEPMDLITRFNAEAFRYYFLRECPYPGDGEYSIGRFADLYNADLANNLGNLYSRVIRLVAVNYDARLGDTAGKAPKPIDRYIGRRMRMRRIMLAMSQVKLGAALGLTFQSVQKYEKGANRIGASRLQEISDILQVPVAFFFEGAPNASALHGSDGSALSMAQIDDFVSDLDGLRLIRAFRRIDNTAVRRRIVMLVQEIAGDE